MVFGVKGVSEMSEFDHPQVIFLVSQLAKEVERKPTALNKRRWRKLAHKIEELLRIGSGAKRAGY